MAMDPILKAKTIQAFILALNEKFGTQIPNDGAGKKILVELLAVKITVTAGDGNPLLYCAQADVPSTTFGLADSAQGTVVLQFFDGLAQVVFKKCTESIQLINNKT
tara:strand:+ start:15019 stop:15336 length:318 start_codon:yes stop_codon:yes gene_type:complete